MLKYKRLFIIIVFIYICYQLVSINYLKFYCVDKQMYDFLTYKNERFNYLNKFNSEIELKDYVPDWCFISSQKDLKQNNLGSDLSNLDLSNIDFNKNNILITFGCELNKIKIYKPLKSIGSKIKYVDVYAKKYKNNILYIYIIDKVEVRNNPLSPKVIITN